MGYWMSNSAFDEWLEHLWQEGEVFGPTRFENKGAFSDTTLYSYGLIHSRNDLVLDHKTYLSPKAAAFPIRETLFYFDGDSATTPEMSERPIYVFLRACDINGFDRLDNIFLHNGPHVDPYYANRRNRLRFLLIECTDHGFKNCFCVSMGTNITNKWHAVVRLADNGIVMQVNNDLAGEEDIINELTNGLTLFAQEIDEFMPVFVTKNLTQVSIPSTEKLNNSIFDHPVWNEYTQRCIGCGRGNTSCITCSCFTMQDIRYDERRGERRRRWASCHIKGYTDMAGGDGYRSKTGERMRFKTMHKINDYYKRFGTHMCVGCGRCDDVCPEYISFSKCINRLTDIIAEKEGK